MRSSADASMARIAAGAGYVFTKIAGHAKKFPRVPMNGLPWVEVVEATLSWRTVAAAKKAEKEYQRWSATVTRSGATTHACDAFAYSLMVIALVGVNQLVSAGLLTHGRWWPAWRLDGGVSPRARKSLPRSSSKRTPARRSLTP